jgi:drug/metabolite transporter (DMT)-like permease
VEMLHLALGALIIGFTPIFVKFLTLSPAMIGVYRCGLGALLLLVILGFQRKIAWASVLSARLPRATLGLLIFGAVFYAIDLYLWHQSVVYVGSGIATLLSNTQSIYLVLLSRWIERERWPRFFLLGFILSLVGVFLLIDESPSWVRTEEFLPGIIFGAASGLAYAVFIYCLRKAQLQITGERSAEMLYIVSLYSALSLLLVAAVEGSAKVPVKLEWLHLILLAWGAHVGGWYLITKYLPRVKLAQGALILLLQPVFAALLGFLIFGETLTNLQMGGIVLTLTGVALTKRQR